MHAKTEALIIKELLAAGLNEVALPIIRDLFGAIEHGHTALLLNEKQEYLVGQLSDELSQLLSVYKGRLQIKRHAAQEKRIAKALLHQMQQTNYVADPLMLMPNADASQQQAIVGAITNKFALILGGPGTGKTETAAAVVMGKLLNQGHPRKVALVAPTGKAAVRLNTSFRRAVDRPNTSFQPSDFAKASTIHRQLKNLNSCDVVLVDEASMVSLDLMDRLLASIGPQTHLILMGDPNQLTSVEAGSVLAMLAYSNRLNDNRFILTEQHRIAEEPFLADLQSSCLAGDSNTFLETLNSNPKSWIKHGQEPVLEKLIKSGYAAYLENLSKDQFVEPKFQVLASTGFGLGGRQWVNQLMLDNLTSSGMLGKGNRYLVTENQPILGIYNGDIGTELNDKNHSIPLIHFNQLEKAIGKSQISGLELAFAISIHRSQGSEYDQICINLTQQNRLAPYPPTRELLYTALTRAKQQITLYASRQQIEFALGSSTRRMSCLHLFLDGEDLSKLGTVERGTNCGN